MRPDAFQGSFGYPCVFNPMETGLAIEDVWPSLYIGADRVDEMKRKIEELDWAKQAFERMTAEAETILKETPDFVTELFGQPIGSAGRSRMHSDAGHYLSFDPQRRCRNLLPMWNPNTREFVQPHEGAPEAWTVLQHERTRRLISSMGFLWKLSGDARYSNWAWDGLRALATCYEEYAKTHDEVKTPYRYFYGGLYEAQCQLQVVQALELLDGAPGGGEGSSKRIRDKVITPGCEAISRWMNVMMVHNMSVWSMSALVEAGRVLGRDEWIKKAFHSERCGLAKLLEKGLPRNGKTGMTRRRRYASRRRERSGKPDGFWYEHSPFYGCFYVVTAITPLVRAGEQAGIMTDDLRERFASFFDAMPHFADSELRLLSISDRVAPGTMRLTQARHLYEYAAGQVDEKHAGLLALLYKRCGASRNSLAALAFGPDELPEAEAPRTLVESCTLPEAGLATFRASTPKGKATLWFQNLRRYPDGAQGHHHMDKLSLSLHAFGTVITSDLGWPGCESKESRRGVYLNGTLSHNTIMLDEYDQGTVETLNFETHMAAKRKEVPWARGSFRGNSSDKMWQTFLNHHGGRLQEGLYDDAVITRTVWFDFPRIVILDELDTKPGHVGTKRFGFAVHARGQMIAKAFAGDGAAALSLPALPEEGAWSCFAGRASADPVALFIADWRVRADIYLRLMTVSDGAFDAHWGTTPDNPTEITRGSIYLRAPGRKRRFATVLDLHEGTPTVAEISVGDTHVALRSWRGDERTYGVSG